MRLVLLLLLCAGCTALEHGLGSAAGYDFEDQPGKLDDVARGVGETLRYTFPWVEMVSGILFYALFRDGKRIARALRRKRNGTG